MSLLKSKFAVSVFAGATLLAAAAVPMTASAQGNDSYAPVTLYFTRHAEKKNTLITLDDGHLGEWCGESKCAQELNAEGLLRAELLAEWFKERGITAQLTHAFSSHKKRTLQTISQIAKDAGLNGDVDEMSGDGVQQLPFDGTELSPEKTGPSEAPTVEAILGLPGGSVAVIAGHSGTIYDIMDDLGLDTIADPVRYPRDEDDKVRDFGDIWKVVIYPYGGAQLHWAVKLDATRLSGVWR